MKMTISKTDIVKIIGTVLLLGALFVAMYFFIIYPKKEAVQLKETELKSEEQLLSTLQNKAIEASNKSFENVGVLQHLVPVKPFTQQLLLDIEKAEAVSDSFVVSMEFEDGEITEEAQPANGQATTNENSNNDNKEQQANQNNNTEKTDTKNTISLPVGVNKITATLEIESPTYFEFERFLTKLEGLDRIIVIESIDFNAGEEIISDDQVKKPLSYQVEFSAFYMPNLTDLLDQLPKIESPEPSNKKNPLSTFGNYNKDKIQGFSMTLPKAPTNNSEDSLELETNKTIKIVEYTVQPGDTLEKIAMEFYQSKKGIEIIKLANQLESNKILAGQVLIIPLKL